MLNRVTETIYLTQNKDTWITIDYLPKHLCDYAREHFDELFELHPTDRSKVLVFNFSKEKSIFVPKINGKPEEPEWLETVGSRWYKSYGKTPSFV